jgi:hypothetical protein
LNASHLEEVVAFADLAAGDTGHPSDGSFAAAAAMRSLKNKTKSFFFIQWKLLYDNCYCYHSIK